MIATLTERARDKGSYAATISFTDENGDAVSPTAVEWSLYDGDGNVVNNRQDVSESPAATVTILLQDDDLDIGPVYAAPLFLFIDATYNSSLGSGLPLKLEYRIIVQGLAVE